eukprot:scaffold1208_cov239-Alexandrium_tamarense.AAC.2
MKVANSMATARIRADLRPLLLLFDRLALLPLLPPTAKDGGRCDDGPSTSFDGVCDEESCCLRPRRLGMVMVFGGRRLEPTRVQM